jgi:hypothetical protein
MNTSLWLWVEADQRHCSIGRRPVVLDKRWTLELADEVVNLDSQCIGNDFQSLNGYVALPALNFPDMRAVEAGAIGEDVL